MAFIDDQEIHHHPDYDITNAFAGPIIPPTQ